MSDAVATIAADDPVLSSHFAKEMVKQLKALDTYDMYEKWSDGQILSPLIMTKERKAEIPVIGDPDDITMSRVKAYYNALSCLIENETGLMAVPMINLTHEGFGRAMIFVGRLIVVNKTLRDVHRFGFKTSEKMVEESDKIVTGAAELVEKYREVAKL